MKPKFNRRHILRGTGAALALPALESLGFSRFTASANSSPEKPPKRVAFLGFGFGVTQETWYPETSQKGFNYDVPLGLRPLTRHKDDFTVIQGCSNKFSNEAHWGSTFWLTGANRYSEAGQSMTNSISADQIAAQALGQNTRYSSVQLGSTDATASGHGPGLSLSWDANGKPISGLSDPVELFHKLFSADKLPLNRRKAAIAEKRSVLDAVLTEANRIQRGLTKTDKDKLDEYFQGVRDIETQLSKDEQWLTIPKAAAPIKEPDPGLRGYDEIKIMYELMVAAFQTDTTRVMTYRQPVQSLLQSISVNVASHNMSHYTPGVRMEASKARDKAQSELLAGFIDKLKATKEVDGSRLFDHIALAYGSNIRSIHFLDNCPTVITGGGANLKLGQHLVLPEDTPLCNVWLTMLQGVGIETDSHGDSTGIVAELQA